MFFALILIYLVSFALCGVALVEDDSTFDCSGLTVDYLAGNPALIQAIQQACAADVHCAAMFALEELYDTTTFALLLQISEPHPDPLSYQSPLLEIICGKTTNEALAVMWVRSLIVAVNRLERCGPDEQFALLPGGTDAKCRPMLHSTYNSPGNYYGFIISSLICVNVLLVCICLNEVYKYYKML